METYEVVNWDTSETTDCEITDQCVRNNGGYNEFHIRVNHFSKRVHQSPEAQELIEDAYRRGFEEACVMLESSVLYRCHRNVPKYFAMFLNSVHRWRHANHKGVMQWPYSFYPDGKTGS